MTETERYVRRRLKDALTAVQSSQIAAVQNGLSIYEKALIYHYTWDGYLSINRSLRKSSGNKAAQLLDRAIAKLPNWTGLVYRTAKLTKKQHAAYKRALAKDIPITERSFVSTSRSASLAHGYPHWNTQFRIFLRTGKSVEECSRLGRFSPPNEQEVLSRPGGSFRVLEVNDLGGHTLIIMREV